MDISIESLGVCLDLLSAWQPSMVLPDGSTNMDAAEHTRKVTSARQEILAAFIAKRNAQQSPDESVTDMPQQPVNGSSTDVPKRSIDALAVD